MTVDAAGAGSTANSAALATAEDIDTGMQLGCAHPMGPLRLLDEVGLDIATHAADSLHAAYGERMKPSGSLDFLTSGGHLGKKSGRGFYDYSR